MSILKFVSNAEFGKKMLFGADLTIEFKDILIIPVFNKMS